MRNRSGALKALAFIATTDSLDQMILPRLPRRISFHRALLLNAIGALILFVTSPVHAAREIVSLDFDWRFCLGDDPAFSRADFGDGSWRTLNVPHDWAWEAPYSRTAAQTDKGGYKPGGIGWYRRAVTLPESDRGRNVRLEFDGIYMDSEVWLNGEKIGGRAYGYISFGVELTGWLRPGRNVLAVRVDNSREPSARWYHGCGIYAPVRLIVTDADRVAPEGVQITTPKISDVSCIVKVNTAVKTGSAAGAVTLRTRLLGADGAQVAVTESAVNGNNVEQELVIGHPQRWDLASPVMYTAVSEVVVAGNVVDAVRTRFGVRETKWEIATGFWLNGRNVKLRGVGEHLEAGPVGAAWPDKLIRWRLEQLKAMGVNAIRTAHSPQVPRFYELCDELGLLVMDEIFDGWQKKAAEDYGARFFDANWEQDLRDWLRRDRNHPSVIIYSVGNETKGKIAAELLRVCHEMDPTRPVTSGQSESAVMDVLGVNGISERQRFLQELTLTQPFVATEVPHTWQVRGYYRTRTWYRDGFSNRAQDPYPLPDLTEKEIFTDDWAPATAKSSAKQIFNSSYDNAMVRMTARKGWELLRDLPWYAGQFRWTGFDYVGEAGYVHGGWPFRAFMGGALDLAGFRKDHFYFYQSQWTGAPMVHLLPHWTHPRMPTGTLIPVWAYSNAEEVELFCNGKSLGRKRPGTKAEEMQCSWTVPWTPGTLEAVAYRAGREVSRTHQTTAAAPARLEVETDNYQLVADGRDTAIVTVAQNDAAGIFYPYGENRIGFQLEGPARIVSLENGNPVDTEPNYGVASRRTFYGLARAFIQSTRESGEVAVVVGAINGERRQLTSSQVTIEVKRVGLRGGVRPADWEIYYTVDGTEPTTNSRKYSSAFPVSLGTTVRALVFEQGKTVMRLEESFASDAGLHWQEGTESVSPSAIGLQAEDARLEKGATVKTTIGGHRGAGYVEVPAGGTVEWYQENDGAAANEQLRLRWCAAQSVEVEWVVNGRVSRVILRGTAANEKTWMTADFPAAFQSGGNTIRLSVRSGGPLLVDELSVTAER